MKRIFLSLIALSTFAYTSSIYSQEISSSSRFGAEAGLLWLSQSKGGNTLTVLPAFNVRILDHNTFSLNAQIGATAYKDDRSDKNFWIGVLRFNPIYKIEDSKFSIEGLLGVQLWETKGMKADIGLRANYDVQEWTHQYLDQVFLGGGIITHDNQTNYLTLGLKKWF